MYFASNKFERQIFIFPYFTATYKCDRMLMSGKIPLKTLIYYVYFVCVTIFNLLIKFKVDACIKHPLACELRFKIWIKSPKSEKKVYKNRFSLEKHVRLNRDSLIFIFLSGFCTWC